MLNDGLLILGSSFQEELRRRVNVTGDISIEASGDDDCTV